MIHNMTRGVVRFNTEVVPSPTLTEISDSLMITADNIKDDVKLFNITTENYDQVYVVGPQSAWG